MKTCNKCKKELSLDKFHIHSVGKNKIYYCTICKDCKNRYERERSKIRYIPEIKRSRAEKTLIKIVNNLLKDLEDYKKGKIDITKLSQISKSFQTILKGESIMLQYKRIEEREQRLHQIFKIQRLVNDYHNKGYSYNEISKILERDHNIIYSKSSVHRLTK